MDRMDNRRYDRTADQLSQVLWHYTKYNTMYRSEEVQALRHQMMFLMTQALAINDQMAELNEKGCA